MGEGTRAGRQKPESRLGNEMAGSVYESGEMKNTPAPHGTHTQRWATGQWTYRVGGRPMPVRRREEDGLRESAEFKLPPKTDLHTRLRAYRVARLFRPSAARLCSPDDLALITMLVRPAVP